MALADLVKDRMGGATSNILIQLTNDDPTVTTINNTVLGAASNDALGEFERITGIAFDEANRSHVSISVQGVLYFLENYKSRNSSIMSEHKRAFYSACIEMRKRVYISPITNSALRPSRQRDGALPDHDRDNRVWSNRRIRNTEEILGEITT